MTPGPILSSGASVRRSAMPKVVRGYKEQARERIVDAAVSVFRRGGLPGGTMEEIAREIGVSKGALYLYFPTKTKLLVAVQARFRAQYYPIFERNLARGDPAQGIVDSIEGVLDDFDPAVWHQLMAQSRADPEVRQALREDAREDARTIRRILRSLEAEGRIGPLRDPEAVTSALLLLLQGTFVSVSLGGDPAESKRRLVRALRVVLDIRPPRK